MSNPRKNGGRLAAVSKVSSEICYLKSVICNRRGRYFCSVGVGVEAGAFVAGGFAGWLVCAGGVGSPRIPSLNSRTPCPRPFITSGILRPPKSTRMTIAIISKCMGLSHMGPYLSHLGRAQIPIIRIPLGQSITRSSPTLRVTCSRSRNSSSGMAYFRLTPATSLNATTVIRSPRSFLYFEIKSRRPATAVR